MSLAEEGAYIRALAHQWLEGSIPADDKKLSKILKGTTGKALAAVKSRFTPHETLSGRLVNLRLEEERDNRQGFVESQRDRVKKRWDGYRGITNASVLPDRFQLDEIDQREEREEREERDSQLAREDNPAELERGDKDKTSQSSVTIQPEDELASLMLYKVRGHTVEEVPFDGPVFKATAKQAQSRIKKSGLNRCKALLKFARDDKKFWLPQFLKASTPMSYFCSEKVFDELTRQYEEAPPPAKAQAEAKKETRDTTTNPFAKFPHDEDSQ
jgi:uncharacterized protein YdaU (DUF1376 family)